MNHPGVGRKSRSMRAWAVGSRDRGRPLRLRLRARGLHHHLGSGEIRMGSVPFRSVLGGWLNVTRGGLTRRAC